MEYLRTLNREFEAGEETDLRVDNRSGSVTVHGEDTQQIRIEVVARLWANSDQEADEQLALIERNIKQEGARLTVRAPELLRPGGLLSIFGRGPRIDYQLAVPRATKAQLINRTGRVEVAALAGPVDIDVRTGRIVVGDIGGDVTVTSRTGSVQIEAIEGSLAVESRTGKLDISRCKGDVSVRAKTGSLRIEEVGGRLRVETTTGSIRYDGKVRDSFDIHVTTGSIFLAVDPDSLFFLDAATTTGSVRSDLPLRRAPDIASSGESGGPTVRIRATTGSIQVVAR